MIRSIVRTAPIGCAPTEVSPDSITASAPSSTALATSEASARVGREFTIIDSSIWVATMTGLLRSRAAWIARFCTSGTCSSGSSTPRSPRATMMPSKASTMASRSLDRLGLLQLGDDRDLDVLLAHDLAHQLGVVGRADEGQRDEVDAQLQGEAQVLLVLVRQRRDAHGDAGQGQALVVRHRAALDDEADDVGALDRTTVSASLPSSTSRRSPTRTSSARSL